MRHYHNHTEGFEKDWKLIRETASSQKFRVTTENTKIEVDIHYMAEKILTVNLVVEGHATKNLLVPVYGRDRTSRSLPGRLRRHRLHPVRYGTPR
jgi:hypothetical protein